MIDRILDLSLVVAEGLRIFQDRKPDRLLARADRREDRAEALRERAKAALMKGRFARAADLEMKAADCARAARRYRQRAKALAPAGV